MKDYLPFIQIIIAICLVAFILLQQRGAALGSAFGGGGGGGGEAGFYSSRRGFQKKLYWLTIVFGGLFVISALLNLIL